jgi:hypothetical protein
VCGQRAYMPKLEKRGGGVLVGEFAYTWCTPARRISSAFLATCRWQPPATPLVPFLVLAVAPTCALQWVEDTEKVLLRHPGATCRGVGGHQAVSLQPLLDTSPASGPYRCLLLPVCRHGA